MDPSSIFTLMIGKLWFLIPVAIIAAVLKSPWFKGIMGEFMRKGEKRGRIYLIKKCML